MIMVLCMQFLAESLDVVRDTEWVISLGKAFARQYALYAAADEHSALLHRYMSTILCQFPVLCSVLCDIS